jgi:hypothetical protein
MNKPTPPEQVRFALRRLTAPHALAFGSRLLQTGGPGTITFREFVDVARDLVQQLPEQAAVYLAGLVALDMANEDCLLATQAPHVRQPSAN